MNPVRKQAGAALFTALIFLIIVTMLSLTAMRASVLELRMAGNQGLKNTAFQRAQSVIDSTVADTMNMSTLLDENEVNCLPLDSSPDCDLNNIALADNFMSTETDLFDGDPDDGEVASRVVRLAPLEAPAPRSVGTSGVIYSVATFRVSGDYDKTAIGQGGSEIVEGVMVLISK